MSQPFGREAPRLSAADFNFDALERRAARRPASASLLQIASAAGDARLSPRVEPNEESQAAQTSSQQPTQGLQTPGLQLSGRSDASATVTVEKVGDFLELDFRRLFTWLRAGLASACVLALLGGAAAGSYAMLAKKRFTVATDVLINPANLQIVENDLFSQSAQVDSQLLTARSKQRVLTSRNVLSRVVDELHLADDPEFTGGASATGSAARDPKVRALDRLQERVNAEADERSFVTTMTVSAETAGKAIAISQAIVKTFQEELAKTESEGASRAAAALDGRLDQLKREVMEAEDKVENYRRDHNLSSSNGQLVSSQAMTQMNSRIVQAQARAGSAEASYDTLVAGGANGTNASPAVSETLAELRNSANTVRQDLESQSALLGPRHPAILKLRVALDTINAQVKAEYAHTVQVAKADRDAAKIALDSLVGEMNALQGNVFSDRKSEVALRELERDATSRTAIYESFLSRARQITERQQIDTTNVQVISAPVPPKGRSWPPSTLVLAALGTFGGFALGMVLAVLFGIRRDLRQPAAVPRADAA